MASIASMRGDTSGSAVIGFALATPVFLMLVVGAIELGRLGLAAYSVRDAVVTSSRMFRLFPLPSDETVSAAVVSRFAVSPSDTPGSPEITDSTVEIGTHTVKQKTISFTVEHRMSIPFMSVQTVPLTYQTTIATH